MARPLSPEKRNSLLISATCAVAEQGVLATTASVARGAGVAEGTLFTYFDSKETLLQSLYLHLKEDVRDALFPGYPFASDVRSRLSYIFGNYVRWGLANPVSRSAIARLSASGMLSPETLATAGEQFAPVYQMMEEGMQEGILVKAPVDFLFAVIEDIAEATIDYIDKHPHDSERYLNLAQSIVWRAVTR
jgi:AcrR family transcriptional regulator